MSKFKEASKASETSDTQDLVSLLLQANATTLATIDQQLQELQREIDEFVGARRQRIESLKVLRKVIDVQVNGRPAKGATEGPTKMEVYTEKIRQLLDREGSMPIPAIAASLNLAPVIVGKIANNGKWFEKRNGEVHLVGDGA